MGKNPKKNPEKCFPNFIWKGETKEETKEEN